MQILYDNKVFEATITATTENPDFPLTYLLDKRVSKKYKTMSASDQAIVFQGPFTVSRIAIAGHNFSVDSMIRIQGNNTNDWAFPALNELVEWKAGIIVAGFTECTYNYFRLFVDDTESNSNDYLEIGVIFLGVYLQCPGMKIDQVIEHETNSENSVSPGGQLYGVERITYRNITVNFNATEAQRLALEVFFLDRLNVKPFFVLVWASREDLEPPRYCFNDQKKLSFKRSDDYTVPWAVSLKLREVF